MRRATRLVVPRCRNMFTRKRSVLVMAYARSSVPCSVKVVDLLRIEHFLNDIRDFLGGKGRRLEDPQFAAHAHARHRVGLKVQYPTRPPPPPSGRTCQSGVFYRRPHPDRAIPRSALHRRIQFRTWFLTCHWLEDRSIFTPPPQYASIQGSRQGAGASGIILGRLLRPAGHGQKTSGDNGRGIGKAQHFHREKRLCIFAVDGAAKIGSQRFNVPHHRARSSPDRPV